MDKLENIGFYTLENERAKNSSITSPLWRCELLVTRKCNFNCPYCRKTGPQENLTFENAKHVIDCWANEGLQNVRFSGGEPTIWPHLIDLVDYTNSICDIRNIAISTNGSKDSEYYDKLINAGVTDFSISLDACCSSTGDMMSGVQGSWQKVIDNIKHLSRRTYVTVGVVLTENNENELPGIIYFAHNLGVADIRIISAAQWNEQNPLNVKIDSDITNKHPILKYRLDHLCSGRNVRGIQENDFHKCPLVLDDMAVMDGKHYPCIIYMREGGKEIGKVGHNMRKEREKWFENTDTSKDPICRKNCLDVCIDYNNKWRDYH